MTARQLHHVLTIAFFLTTLAVASAARAQYPLDVLHEFERAPYDDGPAAPLIQGRDGNLYGTTYDGGTFNRGTVFRMTRAGVVTVLHSFTGGGDGAQPQAALLEASDGNFYGVTITDCCASNDAAIFRVSPAGEFHVLQRFGGTGFSPLVQGNDGALYGTASFGGAVGGGLIFRITLSGAFSVLHEFAGRGAGANPIGLTQGGDGNFYGTTAYGGTLDSFCTFSPLTCGFGTVFRMTPEGALTTLHAFTDDNGAYPVSGLTEGPDGRLYGITNRGGFPRSSATIYRMTPAGAFTVVNATTTEDGLLPRGTLTLARDGSFYGTAFGLALGAAIFRLAPAGTITVLHTFEAATDGLVPLGIVQANDGNFYGTTARHTPFDGLSTAFVMDVNGATRTLHRFPVNQGGMYPSAPLMQANDGNFYGLTSYGGAYDRGTIFRMTPAGQFTLLYTFTGAGDGGHPASALVQGADGRLYGTASFGVDAPHRGVMFRLTLDGRFAALHTFTHDEGTPGGLTVGADGNFYGTTSPSSGHSGLVYRATRDGAITILHTFSGRVEVDGGQPSALIRASDGHFYGTASDVAFRIAASGSFATLGRLGGYGYSRWLTQGADGQLYGADLCAGTLFRMSLSGVVTPLPSLGTSCSDYLPFPSISLASGSDGMVYGVLANNPRGEFPPGNSNSGTVLFRVTPGGGVTVMQDLQAFDPRGPIGIVEGRDGKLYGTVAFGGAGGAGAIFRMNHRVPPAPTAIVVTRAGINGVTLRWNGSAAATSYLVRRLIADQAPTVIASGLVATSLTVPLDTTGADVSYVVTAVNAAGESLASTPMHVPWGLAGSRTPTVTTVRDFDGDGKADLTVYRSATAQWFTHRSVDDALAQTPWGAPALLDRPVAADYDGDGKSDVAVYRETTGEWFIHRSSDGAADRRGWGAPGLGDLPVPADYDGDGRADLAVFRTSTGEWFIHRSSDFTLLYFGWGAPALGDLPVPADYDGDGRTDIAVYRGTTAEWFVRQSPSGALLYLGWGSPAHGDAPVPADYDGDGRTDVAVYRATTGEWFVRQSQTGALMHFGWGSPAFSDVPVPADYDGDGRADLAVYRFSAGEWFIVQNAQPRQFSWGAPLLGDSVRKY